MLLLAIGLCTFVLAGVLAVLGFTGGNARLLRYALVYVIASAICISLRALLVELKQRRKRRVRQRREQRLTLETAEP